MANLFKSMLAAAQGLFQSKTVAAGTSDKIITPDTGYDALSSVTIQPTPSQSKSVTPSATSQTVTPDTGKLLSSVSVDAVSLQSKSVTATTTAQTVTSDSGYTGLSEVTVNPQSHSETYTPAANTSNNNMGTNHNYKYVDTSGMYKPSGTYSAGTYTTNGTKTISGLSNYAATSFTINVPTGVTPTSITPSNTHPVYMSENTAYKPTSDGYAIIDYDTITPSSSGTAFSNSDLIMMTSGGYAYSEKPSPELIGTYLWENASPSSSFAEQTITLSQSITDFKYIGISWKLSLNSSTSFEVLINVNKFDESLYLKGHDFVGLCGYHSTSSKAFCRPAQYISATQIKFYTARVLAYNETNTSNWCIPTYVVGYN